jgi:hypothetical protein
LGIANCSNGSFAIVGSSSPGRLCILSKFAAGVHLVHAARSERGRG